LWVCVRQAPSGLPGACWQRMLTPLQVSVVHRLPSSVQAVPFAFLVSDGQVWPATPVHVSARSQSPPAARHTVPAAVTTSAGQLLLVPSQLSAGSHASPDPARQTKVFGRTPSAGQVVLVPVQVSATSHAPVAARHAVPPLPAACVQRGLPTVPLHLSVVQTLPSSVHAVVFDLTTSVGQVVLVPLQVSVRSHSLTAARHTVPAFPAGCVQVALVPLQTSRVQTLPSSVHTVVFALKRS